MNKRIYMKPQMEAVDIRMHQQLLAGSNVVDTITTGGDGGSIGVDYGGGGSGPVHSRELDIFDEFMF